MSTRTMMVATLGAALGSGGMSGAFFAFSTMVMGALERLAPPQLSRKASYHGSTP